jgi:hypothetical protein
MPSLYLPDAEVAYIRTVLLAVELLDAVTLETVTREVRVSAPPLDTPPFVNGGGRFIWLLNGPARPRRITVEPGGLPYEREEIAAPVLPADLDSLPLAERESRRLRLIWLRPRRGYRFPDGVTVLRGRLTETAPPAPPVAAAVWIEWLDAAGVWLNYRERMFTRTGADGEFVAFLRLKTPASPTLDEEGLMQVRLGVERSGAVARFTGRFAVREGWQGGDVEYYKWDELTGN